MNRLIASVMLATIAAVVVEIAGGGEPAWLAWVSLALVLPPVALAARRTVPSAVRLGARHDAPARQSELARSILGDHLFCISAITALLVLQLAFG
jgi:carbon starvation protein CstA